MDLILYSNCDIYGNCAEEAYVIHGSEHVSKKFCCCKHKVLLSSLSDAWHMLESRCLLSDRMNFLLIIRLTIPLRSPLSH